MLCRQLPMRCAAAEGGRGRGATRRNAKVVVCNCATTPHGAEGGRAAQLAHSRTAEGSPEVRPRVQWCRGAEVLGP